MAHTSCCTETLNVTEYMHHIQLVVLYGMAGCDVLTFPEDYYLLVTRRMQVTFV